MSAIKHQFIESYCSLWAWILFQKTKMLIFAFWRNWNLKPSKTQFFKNIFQKNGSYFIPNIEYTLQKNYIGVNWEHWFFFESVTHVFSQTHSKLQLLLNKVSKSRLWNMPAWHLFLWSFLKLLKWSKACMEMGHKKICFYVKMCVREKSLNSIIDDVEKKTRLYRPHTWNNKKSPT